MLFRFVLFLILTLFASVAYADYPVRILGCLSAAECVADIYLTPHSIARRVRMRLCDVEPLRSTGPEHSVARFSRKKVLEWVRKSWYTTVSIHPEVKDPMGRLVVRLNVDGRDTSDRLLNQGLALRSYYSCARD